MWACKPEHFDFLPWLKQTALNNFPLAFLRNEDNIHSLLWLYIPQNGQLFQKWSKIQKVQLSTPQHIPPHALEENNPKLDADHNTQRRRTLTPVKRLCLCHHSSKLLMVQNTLLKLASAPTPLCLFTLMWCCLFLQGACSHSTPVKLQQPSLLQQEADKAL